MRHKPHASHIGAAVRWGAANHDHDHNRALTEICAIIMSLERCRSCRRCRRCRPTDSGLVPFKFMSWWHTATIHITACDLLECKMSDASTPARSLRHSGWRAYIAQIFKYNKLINYIIPPTRMCTPASTASYNASQRIQIRRSALEYRRDRLQCAHIRRMQTLRRTHERTHSTHSA